MRNLDLRHDGLEGLARSKPNEREAQFIRMFGASAPDLMERYVKDQIAHLIEE